MAVDTRPERRGPEYLAGQIAGLQTACATMARFLAMPAEGSKSVRDALLVGLRVAAEGNALRDETRLFQNGYTESLKSVIAQLEA